MSPKFPLILAHEIAHDADAPVGPRNWGELWHTWGWEPVSWLALILTAYLYIAGLRRIRRASRTGGGVKRWEAACFALGWAALFVALVSPLHPWGQVLMSAHMTQHEILMLVAAPLMVLGRPLVVFMSAIPTAWARALAQASNVPWWRTTWGVLCAPLVAWLIHAVALWAWHVPDLFDATLRSERVHFLQHASFFLTALVFWWALMTSRSAVMSYGVALLYMFTTAMHTQVLGALMTFSKTVWYPTYLHTTQSWGLEPLEDQQLGGLIMWIPAGLVYVIAALALLAGWLRESERRVARYEAQHLASRAAVMLAILLSICTGCDEMHDRQVSEMTGGGNADRGREKIAYYGCTSCHLIPGVRGADGLVGPPLQSIGSRAYVGGVVPNTPQNLIAWIQDPPAIDPQTAMPNVRVSAPDARDIAAYLYTLN